MIRLTGDQLTQIQSAATEAYPAECCGLLVGKNIADDVIEVSRIVPSVNVLADKGNDRFEIDPQTRIDLERNLRGTTDSIIGHYHSHPDHPAIPSNTDLAQAYEPDLIWLIVSVRAGAPKEVKAHRLETVTQKFTEIECVVS